MSKRIIIVGGGFAGLRLGRELKDTDYEIWLFDKNNFYQFQPLFYQVATGGLEPSSISFPLRKIFQKHKNCHVRMAEALAVDREKNILKTTIGDFAYDHLVIAVGATTNFFGNEAVEKNAIPMKSVSEALYLRNAILQNFEKALSAPPEEKKTLLNVVVVGGGPTGVEVSGALSEMRKYILPKDYPEIDFKQMNIYLIEGSPKTLGAMSEEASRKSKEYLEKLGVKVMTNLHVKNYNGEVVELSNGETIKTRMVIWGAGVIGNKLQGLPESSVAKGNRLLVNEYNVVEGTQNILAIGDIALMKEENYPNGHPQVATVAIDQGKHLAKNFKNILNGKAMEPFHFKDKGSMATVGRHLAVVDLPFMKFQGFWAWVFWMFLHLMLVLGVKNKLLIFVNWLWKYFTFDQSLRLIIKPFKKPL
jgi:NADH:ubiquinone reductase (H+-translocating)